MVYVVTPTRDSNWIATKCLSRLGAASVDNPPSAEDMQLALDQLDATLQDLMKRGLCYLADLDKCDAPLATWLAERVAIELKPDFGNNTPDGQSALKPLALVELAIRRLSADVPSYGPQTVSFY